MRRRLVLVALAVTTMIVLAFLVPLAALTQQLARDRVLNRAERDAQLIALFITAEPETGPELAVNTFATANNDLSIILPDGTVLGAPLPEGSSVNMSSTAFRQREPGGEAVYVPAISIGSSPTTVRVFVGEAALTEGVARSWFILGALGVVLVLIAVAAADRLAQSMVQSVGDLSTAARQLGGGDLETRVDPTGPTELVEVGNEFNRLVARVSGLLQQERELAADLSHRLRTPLTALRLAAERLPEEQRTSLDPELDELERSIGHVIEEARRPGRQDAAKEVDLAAIARERMAFWSALGEEQGRVSQLSIDVPEPVLVTAPATDLEAAIDALLGNVFAHTPEGTSYEMAIRPDGKASIQLTISDRGPGFEVADPSRRGHSGADSTGLGLDIAKRTANAAGGDIELATAPLGGAMVTLRLPRA